MKNIKKLIIALTLCSSFVACKDDYKYPLGGGKPTLDAVNIASDAFFGDSVAFNVDVADEGKELSTLKVQLYFSDDKVAETIIRTKEYGTYRGKIFVPFLKDIPDATARVKFVLENVGLVKIEEIKDIKLSRPPFPFLNLITEKETIKLLKVGKNQYAATQSFPQKVKGYIQAPAYGEEGNVINFGWANDAIVQDTKENIPFSYLSAGDYTIEFNSLTYQASPFQSYKINGSEMKMLDDTHYVADIQISKDEQIVFTDIADLDKWWIDSDFIRKDGDKLYFNGQTGKYRFTADFKFQYFVVEAMNGENLATLNINDGSGALWIIGDGIGKPSLSNQVGWDTGKALCMVPIGNKQYQITVVAGESIATNDINFKFFHQKGWGGEFKSEQLTTNSNLIFVGDGANGRDSGNLGLVTGKTLKTGVTYVLIVDLSKGVDQAELKVSEK